LTLFLFFFSFVAALLVWCLPVWRGVDGVGLLVLVVVAVACSLWTVDTGVGDGSGAGAVS